MRLRLTVAALAAALAACAVPPAERAALVDLYAATQGASWRQATNWLEGDPCEQSWFGIFCDDANSTVTEVFPNPRWSGNTLVGTLPSSLFHGLPNLEHVYTSNDRPGWSRLSGPLPPGIGSLTRLKCFYTSHSGALGAHAPLPSEIGRLTLLQGLYLRWNSFAGPLPDLSNLTNLSSLVLDSAPKFLPRDCPPFCSNAFTGTVASLADLPLRSLKLTNNLLGGEFPPPLCSVHRCEAWANRFTGHPPGCRCFPLNSTAPSDGMGAGDDDWGEGGEGGVGHYNECHEHNFPGGEYTLFSPDGH